MHTLGSVETESATPSLHSSVKRYWYTAHLGCDESLNMKNCFRVNLRDSMHHLPASLLHEKVLAIPMLGIILFYPQLLYRKYCVLCHVAHALSQSFLSTECVTASALFPQPLARKPLRELTLSPQVRAGMWNLLLWGGSIQVRSLSVCGGFLKICPCVHQCGHTVKTSSSNRSLIN